MLIDQYNKDKSLSFKAMSEIRKLNIKIEQLDQKGFENLRKDKNATDRQLMET